MLLASAHIMFTCPNTQVEVRASEPPMTRAQFELWLAEFRMPRLVACAECWQQHVLSAKSYFLEGDRPAA